MSNNKSDNENSAFKKISLGFLIVLIIFVPILSFYFFYKSSDDEGNVQKVEQPYFDSYTETSEELATALYSGSSELIETVIDPQNWKGEKSYYQNSKTQEIDVLITFQMQVVYLDFPTLLDSYDGSYLVSKYTNHGETKFNINSKKILDINFEFSPENITWMSKRTLLYSGDTVYLQNDLLETSTVFAFPKTGMSSSFDLLDKLYDYDLFYNSSSTSNFYTKTKGTKKFLVFEDYSRAFLSNDSSLIVRYEAPISKIEDKYLWSNYDNTPDVILLENENDQNEIYILDFSNSEDIRYYESEEDYIDDQNQRIDNIYDYMDVFGTTDITKTIDEYINSFPIEVMSMFGLSNLIKNAILSQEFETYIVENISTNVISEIKNNFKNNFIENFNKLSYEQQQQLQALFLELDGTISIIFELTNKIWELVYEHGHDVIIDAGMNLIIKNISNYSADEISDLINNLKQLSKATSIQFINMLQNEYNQANSSISSLQTQQKIYEFIVKKAFADSIPSEFMDIILDDPTFELSTKIEDEIVYFYTNKNQDEYFGFDIKTGTLFTF